MRPHQPNPVAQIIAVRSGQVGGTALATLAGLAMAGLPPARLAPLAAWGGLAVAGGLSAYFVATFTAGVPLGAPLLTRLPPAAQGSEAVALTFDDGPHPDTTPRLLDILAEQNARATFFVVGERASRYPEIVARIAREKHTLGVHGLRHQAMVLQSARQIACDLSEAVRRIEDAAGRPLPQRLLRPPFGFKTWTLGRTAVRLGWTLVAWSLDPRDYDSIPPEILAARVRERLAPRSIVLLHERPGVCATPAALPGLLHFVAARGWRCVAL